MIAGDKRTDKRTDKRMHGQIFTQYSGISSHSMGACSHSLGVTDKILMHTEIKHYTNIGIHNDYTSAITVIGTIRYYRTEYNRKQ